MNGESIDKFFESMTQQELEGAFDKYKKYSEDNRKRLLIKEEKFDYNKSNFQKELFNLINSYSKNNLSKPEVVESLEWVLGNTKMS